MGLLKCRDYGMKLDEKRRLGLPDEMISQLSAFEVVLYHIRDALPPG